MGWDGESLPADALLPAAATAITAITAITTAITITATITITLLLLLIQPLKDSAHTHTPFSTSFPADDVNVIVIYH